MRALTLVACLGMVCPGWLAGADVVATALYARVGNGYERERLAAGGFQTEYYALGNGGRIYGTTSDETVDRVTYPEIAGIAMRLLAEQNYQYARTREQAKLLVVLQWGVTLAPNGPNYSARINDLARLKAGKEQGMGSLDTGRGGAAEDGGALEGLMLALLMENRARDQINERNARVLGYLDDINESNDIRRWAGGGDRYRDLVADVEESRYYIVISAYDFPELSKNRKKKLLWQTRVSVPTPGNGFDDSMVAMMKNASRYFGQDSGRLIRGEESKGKVELGDLKFLGEANELPPSSEEKPKP